MMKQAVLYQKIADRTVRCLACSWYCSIAPGRTGICGTRLNKRGVLYSVVYGKAIGLHLDPVEKKPLHHFLPGATLLSFGTTGCNFGCLFCQNWEMSQINKMQQSNVKSQKPETNLVRLINQLSQTVTPSWIVDLARELHADGIAYTYNEPAIFAEFTHDTAKRAKKLELKNVYVSNGFESPETFTYVKDYIDAINIDLKSFRNRFYQKVCRAKIDPVKENIKRFFETGIETEVTTLVIPGYNDSQTELRDIADFLVNISPDIPWHVSAFYPAYRMLAVAPTPLQTLVEAYRIGKKAGLKYVYTGNVADTQRSSTYCPKCNALLVARNGYAVAINALNTKTGGCSACGEKIYGVWQT